MLLKNCILYWLDLTDLSDLFVMKNQISLAQSDIQKS